MCKQTKEAGDAEHAAGIGHPLWLLGLGVASQMMSEATAPPQYAVRGVLMPTVGPQNILKPVSSLPQFAQAGRWVSRWSWPHLK